MFIAPDSITQISPFGGAGTNDTIKTESNALPSERRKG